MRELKNNLRRVSLIDWQIGLNLIDLKQVLSYIIYTLSPILPPLHSLSLSLSLFL